LITGSVAELATGATVGGGTGEDCLVAELATGATVAVGAGEAAFGLAGDGDAPAFGMLTTPSPESGGPE
jgi:hypothetical protein